MTAPETTGAVPRLIEAPPPLTRTEWVDRQLREAILFGELRPGERLITAVLTERFSVSPSPLREALATLAGDGLVEISPQRGARVAPLSLRACRELHELLTVLEPHAFERALERRDADWDATLDAAWAEFGSTWVDGAGLQAAERAFVRLHLAIVSTCGSGWMLRLIRTLIENSGRYRVACLEHADRRPFVDDHDRLVNACRAGDVGLAQSALIGTLDRTVKTAEQLVDSGLLEVQEAPTDG